MGMLASVQNDNSKPMTPLAATDLRGKYYFEQMG